MMTGTPIENNVWMAYLLTVFLVVTGFAVYDILYRRVPDRALIFFIPLPALAPLIQVYFILEHGRTPIFIWSVVAEALVGALLGFCIPLAAAMATGGSGMGGGDIKFCGVRHGRRGYQILRGAGSGLWSLRHGPGIFGSRRLRHAGGAAVPAALAEQTAHRDPVFTFSGLRLLCGDAG